MDCTSHFEPLPYYVLQSLEVGLDLGVHQDTDLVGETEVGVGRRRVVIPDIETTNSPLNRGFDKVLEPNTFLRLTRHHEA